MRHGEIVGAFRGRRKRGGRRTEVQILSGVIGAEKGDHVALVVAIARGGDRADQLVAAIDQYAARKQRDAVVDSVAPLPDLAELAVLGTDDRRLRTTFRYVGRPQAEHVADMLHDIGRNQVRLEAGREDIETCGRNRQWPGRLGCVGVRIIGPRNLCDRPA